MVTAFLYLRRHTLPKLQKMLCSKWIFFGLVCGAQVFLFYSDSVDGLLYPTIIGFICGLVTISYISAFGNVNNKLTRSISCLGTISFSLYLLHSFVKDAIDGIGLGPYVTEKMTLLFHLSATETSILMTLFFYFPVIVALASLTYSTIEKPFLDMRVKYLKGRGRMEEHVPVVDMAVNKIMQSVES